MHTPSSNDFSHDLSSEAVEGSRGQVKRTCMQQDISCSPQPAPPPPPPPPGSTLPSGATSSSKVVLMVGYGPGRLYRVESPSIDCGEILGRLRSTACLHHLYHRVFRQQHGRRLSRAGRSTRLGPSMNAMMSPAVMGRAGRDV